MKAVINHNSRGDAFQDSVKGCETWQTILITNFDYKCIFSFYNKLQIIISSVANFRYILADHTHFIRVKRSYVSTGIRNLIEIARFSS